MTRDDAPRSVHETRVLRRWLLLALLTILNLTGCWESMGNGVTGGALSAASGKIAPLTGEAVTGARDALEEPETQEALLKLEGALLKDAREGLIGEDTKKKLQALLDASMKTLSESAVETEAQLGDQVVEQVGRLREQALGKATQTHIDELKENLIGPATGEQLGALIDTVLSEERLGRIRTELVGEPMQASINALVAGAVGSAADSAQQKLPALLDAVLEPLKKQLDDAEKRAKRWLLVTVLLIITLLLAIVGAWLLIHRDRRVIRVVTKEIENFTNADPAQKKLKKGIKKAADSAGLEEYLHSLLEKNGIGKQPPGAPTSGSA